MYVSFFLIINKNSVKKKAKFDGVVHKKIMASSVITVGGAVINVTAFTGGNYLAWPLSGGDTAQPK